MSNVQKIEQFLSKLGSVGATYREVYTALNMTSQQLENCLVQTNNVCEDDGRLFAITWIERVPVYAI